jgi:hypothetical protein
MKNKQVKIGQTVYVTKYFFSKGIIEATVTDNSLPWDSLDWQSQTTFLSGHSDPVDWYITYE